MAQLSEDKGYRVYLHQILSGLINRCYGSDFNTAGLNGIIFSKTCTRNLAKMRKSRIVSHQLFEIAEKGTANSKPTHRSRWIEEIKQRAKTCNSRCG